jgi:hypothetical protein
MQKTSAQIQYLGAPNVTVVNRGNFKIDSILYLPKKNKTPTDSGALRYQISDSSIYVWTGNQWIKSTNQGTITSISSGTGMSFTTITSSGAVNADTLVLSTRSWRQKGIDSVSSLIAAKLNISDTATMLSPYAKSAALGLYLPLSGGTLTGGLTGTTGAFTSSGSGNTFNITQSSGSGIALNISKGGNGEGLYINKTSGTGNAATIVGTLNATTLVKSGGTATQYLMADGTTSTLTNPVTGTGTTNRSVKFTGTSAVGNGSIVDEGTTERLRIVSDGSMYFKGITSTADGESYFQSNNTSLNIGAAVGGGVNKELRFFFNGTSSGERIRLFNNGRIFLGPTPTDNGYQVDIFGTFRNTTGAALATSAGNVLIGTTTDGGSYKLDVQGALRNTTGAVFATSSGNVGIGTTSASEKLDILGNSGVGVFIKVNETAGGQSGLRLFAGSGANNRATRVDFFNNISSTTVPRWSVLNDRNQNGTNDFSISDSSSTQRFSILQNGNIGISNASPSFRLDVTGTSRFTSFINAQATTTAANGSINVESSDPAIRYRITGGVANKRIFEQRAYASSGTTGNYAVRLWNDAESSVTELFKLDDTGTGTFTNGIDVIGRTRIRTIDSTGTGTAMNMLYSDATGVIKKAAVPSGGSGTVTSVATGFGLSGGTITTTGTLIVDSASVATRARVQKGIDSVVAITVKGSGTTNTVPIFTGTSTLGNSLITQVSSEVFVNKTTDDGDFKLQVQGGFLQKQGDAVLNESGGNTGIGVAAPSEKLHVNGKVRIATVDSTATGINMLYVDNTGVVKKAAVPTGSGTIATAESDISSNYTVTSTDHFVYLPALEGAGRNIVLPNDAVNGRQLIFFNTSNDGSHRWTFTNEDVEDVDGAAVTTLTNRKVYMLVYFNGKFRITAVN